MGTGSKNGVLGGDKFITIIWGPDPTPAPAEAAIPTHTLSTTAVIIEYKFSRTENSNFDVGYQFAELKIDLSFLKCSSINVFSYQCAYLPVYIDFSFSNFDNSTCERNITGTIDCLFVAGLGIVKPAAVEAECSALCTYRHTGWHKTNYYCVLCCAVGLCLNGYLLFRFVGSLGTGLIHERRDLRWRCACLFTFVGTSRGHLCDSTAFLCIFCF